MTTPVIEVANVCRDFGKEHPVRILHNISFSIPEGQMCSLVGPSGCGKSTLLNLVGLLDIPTEGTIHLLGHDAGKMGEEARTRLRGRSIGFVFQFHHLIGALSAVENVITPLAAVAGKITDDMITRGLAVLESVGLAERAHASPRELSGDERQRVAIARALVAEPALVVADEPTGNLDSKNSDAVFSLLRDVNARMGTAFLLVTHDESLASQTDRVLRMLDGRIESDELTAGHA